MFVIFLFILGFSLEDFVYSDNENKTLIACNAQTEEVVIPSTVVTIRQRSFKNCSSKIVAFAEDSQLTTVSMNAFSESRVEKIIFPPSLPSLGYQALESSFSLVEVEITSNITKFSDNLFRYCGNLRNISVFGTFILLNSDLNFLGSFVDSFGSSCFAGVPIKSIYIHPFFNLRLNSGTFRDLVELERISIDLNITTLYDNYFYNCSKLNYIEIFGNVILKDGTLNLVNGPFESIQSQVFDYVPYSKLIFPEQLSLESYTFYNSPEATSIEIHQNFDTFTSYYFYNMPKLTELKIGDTFVISDGKLDLQTTAIASLKYNSFSNLAITEIHFGEGIQEISENSINGNRLLTKIVIDSNLNNIIPAGNFANSPQLEFISINSVPILENNILDFSQSTLYRFSKESFFNISKITKIIFADLKYLIYQSSFGNNSFLERISFNGVPESFAANSYIDSVFRNDPISCIEFNPEQNCSDFNIFNFTLIFLNSGLAEKAKSWCEASCNYVPTSSIPTSSNVVSLPIVSDLSNSSELFIHSESDDSVDSSGLVWYLWLIIILSIVVVVIIVVIVICKISHRQTSYINTELIIRS